MCKGDCILKEEGGREGRGNSSRLREVKSSRRLVSGNAIGHLCLPADIMEVRIPSSQTEAFSFLTTFQRNDFQVFEKDTSNL